MLQSGRSPQKHDGAEVNVRLGETREQLVALGRYRFEVQFGSERLRAAVYRFGEHSGCMQRENGVSFS